MAGQKPQRAAIWSVYATGAIDCADAALLPAVFRALEVEMGLSPSTLALLVLAQSVAGALACPIWGYVVDSGQIERRDLLVLGALWWGLASLLSAAATGFTSLLLARTLEATVLPASDGGVASASCRVVLGGRADSQSAAPSARRA